MKQPQLQGGIELGRNVLKALGMGDGFTHMEWFLTPKRRGRVRRDRLPPRRRALVDQMNYTCDIDLFREWARAVCTVGKFEAHRRASTTSASSSSAPRARAASRASTA